MPINSKNSKPVRLKDETLELIERSKLIFLKHNKKFKGINLTYDFIIRKIAEYYTESEFLWWVLQKNL